MRGWVDFDDWDNGTKQLIDRKWNVTNHPKSQAQAERQAAIARQHGVTIRWEVPKNRKNAAQRLVDDAGADDVITVVGL